jgi:glycosyltransferase involved in cell wall biosynthesis
MRAAAAVSVILPVRNGARYLAGALRSIAEQTVPVAETIVVNDGSTDSSVAIAQRFEMVRVIDKRGPAHADALNDGVAVARGELIAFLAADDEWPARKLEVQLARLAARPRVDACIGLAQHFIEPGDEPPRGLRAELLEGPVPARLPEALLVPRSVFERVGPFRRECGTSFDFDWFLRASDIGVQIAIVPEVILRKRLHSQAASQGSPTTHPGILRAVRESVARKRMAQPR